MDALAGLTANDITLAVVPYLRWIQSMLGHRSVESTQIYTQVSIRALQAVHGSTHPAECIKSEHDRNANNEYD